MFQPVSVIRFHEGKTTFSRDRERLFIFIFTFSFSFCKKDSNLITVSIYMKACRLNIAKNVDCNDGIVGFGSNSD